MTRVLLGDLVFSYADTYLKAIGLVTATAITHERPVEFGTVGAYWNPDGWLVKLEYYTLRNPIRPKQFFDDLLSLLPEKYSPLIKEGRKRGDGVQTFYLLQLPNRMAEFLLTKLSAEDRSRIFDVEQEFEGHKKEDEIESGIKAADILNTTKEQLIASRRGQGRFRIDVEQLEAGCRVTGITQREHLRASHIKPWRDSTDEERLDGNNGLLLSPHIDHLFDKGYICFKDDGRILISLLLSREVLESWHIDSNLKVLPFRLKQLQYLRYHREKVFHSNDM